MGRMKRMWMEANGLPTVHDALAQIEVLDAQGDLFAPREDLREPAKGTCYTCEEKNVELATGVMDADESEPQCWKCYAARMNDIPNSYDRVASA